MSSMDPLNTASSTAGGAYVPEDEAAEPKKKDHGERGPLAGTVAGAVAVGAAGAAVGGPAGAVIGAVAGAIGGATVAEEVAEQKENAHPAEAES